MSAFLGPVHYWLYDKILLFESLEQDLIIYGQNNSHDFSEVVKEINSRYGDPIKNKRLEDIIDHNNIHGWLQGRIQAAELRHAAIIKSLLETYQLDIQNIKTLYEQQAYVTAKNIENDKEQNSSNPLKFYGYSSPKEVFSTLNTYLLEGMPCDRVNAEVADTPEEYVWETSMCIHKPYWDEVGLEIDYFYLLRESWIKTFISALPVKYQYYITIENNKKINTIKKV